ncbi:MAG: beta-N-acetylhexosaminidase [Pseudomonadota bacterium]
MSKKTHYPPAPFVFMDLCSTTLAVEEKKFLEHRLLAGIVLFARNYENPEQLANLLEEVRAINPKLLFAVDQEGGRVQRFKAPFTLLPAMQQLGNIYLLDEEKGKQLARDCAWLVGNELAAFGIHINFAPVLDIDLGLNKVIGDRAFGKSTNVITAMGGAYFEGMHSTHVLPVAKHFPGHGGVNLDSHVDQPIDHRSIEKLWEGDMLPFRNLNAQIAAVMVSHVIYSSVSPMPAGYCKYWLEEMLRNRMHSNALVFSDCLSMKAAQVAGSADTRIRLAREAGCNYVLLCNHSESQWDVLEKVEDEIVSHPVMQPLKSFDSLLKAPASASEALQRFEQLQASEKYVRIRSELESIQ